MSRANGYSYTRQQPNNKYGYINGLNNTWPFKVDLKDWTLPFKILIILFRFVFIILYGVYYLLKLFVVLIIGLCQRSIVLRWVFLALIILCVIGLIDYIAFFGKVYPGVYVGDVDLGLKTAEEAKDLIDENFSYRLSGNNVVIYVDEQAQEEGISEDSPSGISEQLSVEQARQTVRYWKTNSVELEAELPVEEILDEALNSNRGLLNIPKRIGALLFKQTIKPYANYNENAVTSHIERINDTIGTPVVNPTCAIEDGNAYAREGSDGNLIDNNEFIDQLNYAFFQKDPENSSFIPVLHKAKQQISYKSANTLSEKLNKVLAKRVSFTYKNNNWEVDRLNLSSWINIGIENREEENAGCSCSAFNGGNYCIFASVDSNKAGSDILTHTREQNMTTTDFYSIKFQNVSNKIIVKTDGEFEMPSIYDAVDQLNEKWLENPCVYESGKTASSDFEETEWLNVSIASTNIPETLNLEDALRIGVVTEISHYTTTYSSGAGTQNRNQNIALGAELLNNSICEANGGRWSFNQTTGDTNAQAGFLEAGAIVGNKYTKSVGGGICQVATTVFNAVYEGGYQIVSRHNHNLHIASYPAGRDAAVSYPDLDFIWQNNESSDVLMTTSTNGYSVTVNLLGVDPKYTIRTEVGKWTDGDHYKTENVIDPGKAEKSKFVQTSGSDGKSIIIKREVYDRNGNLVSTDEFKSIYAPKTEIIVYGPGDEANKLLEEHQARMKNESDDW